jgi:peroxiredoxin
LAALHRQKIADKPAMSLSTNIAETITLQDVQAAQVLLYAHPNAPHHEARSHLPYCAGQPANQCRAGSLGILNLPR